MRLVKLKSAAWFSVVLAGTLTLCALDVALRLPVKIRREAQAKRS
jgi:hypothetical protein